MRAAFDTLDSLSEEAANIFEILQKNGPLTKNHLLLFTKLKLTTMNRVMQPLEQKGLVVQSQIGQSTGGRKPVLYDINNSKYYIIGVDISRLYTQIVIVNMKMDILAKRRFDMEISSSPENTVKIISGAIREALAKLNIPAEAILGVGIGAVGPLDRDKGVIINPVNFEAPGWTDVPIRQLMEQELGYPVFIDNGANAAVLGEKLFGKGRDIRNIVYFNCGIGIRTGAISSGRVIRTMNDAEDVFGHMVIDVDGEKCSCGNYGCIECYSSIYAIVKKFVSEVKRGRKTLVNKAVDAISYVDICRAAEEKDPLACEIITKAALAFGAGLANFINILNPGLVILSGSLIQHSNMFYELCTESAMKKLYTDKGDHILFHKGGYFKDSAIAVGGAAMVMENCFKSNILGYKQWQ